jgi:NADP-dependent 3-hydroxy acid dehydrogenase YdfG
MAARLEGTVALITGASSGIGEATARALADQGSAVALVARRKERLEHLAQELQSRKGQALVIETDVSDKDQARSAVEHTVAQWGRLDILVNNAGVMLLGPVEQAPLEEWDQMVRVNVLGVLYTTHAALPYLLEAAGEGPRQVADLVNVSSTAGRVARAGVGVYDVTKFGVVAFSEALRQEVTKRHVRVAVVEPGRVATELVSHVREDVREQTMRAFEGFEPLAAEDIADAIVYLVTRPRRMAVNELLIRPTEQEA